MSRFLHSTSADKYYDECPAEFHLYQAGAPRGPVPLNYAFGITAHLVMEDYVNHCIANGRRSDITLVQDFIDAAVRRTGLALRFYDELTLVMREFLRVYEIDVEHSLAREGGIAMDDDLNVIDWSDDVEYDRMTHPATAKGRIFFRCKLDHALLYVEDRTLVVQDYKSDVFAPSKTGISEPSSRFFQQARKYAWAAWRALYPADVVRVEFIFMRHIHFGRPTVRTIDFTKDAILETQDLMVAKARFIEATEEFPATPGDHCARCAFRETACPVRDELELEDPAAIMRKFLLDRVVQEGRRERLKQLVAEHGFDGVLGPLRAAFTATESETPDMERIWRVLEEYDVERPWALMNLSKTNAKRILDKDLYELLIANAYKSDTEIRFNVHQPLEVLQALADDRGIPTQKPGAKGMKNRTIAELAWDLAQSANGSAPQGDDETIEVDLSTLVDGSDYGAMDVPS